MKKALLAAPMIVYLSACATPGHVEWRKEFGDLPLYQAQAQCRYEVTAATPATCQGIIGCTAESQRGELLTDRCMEAKGWRGFFVQDIPVSDSDIAAASKNPSERVDCNANGMTNYISRKDCLTINGSAKVASPTSEAMANENVKIRECYFDKKIAMLTKYTCIQNGGIIKID